MAIGHENLGMGHGPLAIGHENLGMGHRPLAIGHENLGMGHVQAWIQIKINAFFVVIWSSSFFEY